MSGPASTIEHLLQLLGTSSQGEEPVPLSIRDWSALIDEAVNQEVESLLYRPLLGESGGREIPPATLRRLEELYCRTSLDNARIYGELRTVLGAFSSAGIDVVPLKGVYLAQAVYGDIGLRPMSDIDLLVRREDLPVAQRTLLDLGYGPLDRPDIESTCAIRHHLEPFRRPDASMIELHWTIARPTSPFTIDISELWDRAVEGEIAGITVLTLSPEDLVIHLCLHASYNHLFGTTIPSGLPLKHLHDVALFIHRHGQELNWARLAGIARDQGSARFVRCMLLLVGNALRIEVPERELLRLGCDAQDESFVAAIRQGLGGRSSPRRTHEASKRRERKSILRMLVNVIFLPTSRMRRVYGVPAGSSRVFVYYAYRPFDLAVRRRREILQAIVNPGSIRVMLMTGRQRIRRWADGR